MRHEEQVAAAMARREEEIMGAVRIREEEILEVWRGREEEIRKEVSEPVEERLKWVKGREEELEAERVRLDSVRAELEVKVKMLDESAKGMYVLQNSLIDHTICSNVSLNRTERQTHLSRP